MGIRRRPGRQPRNKWWLAMTTNEYRRRRAVGTIRGVASPLGKSGQKGRATRAVRPFDHTRGGSKVRAAPTVDRRVNAGKIGAEFLRYINFLYLFSRLPPLQTTRMSGESCTYATHGGRSAPAGGWVKVWNPSTSRTGVCLTHSFFSDDAIFGPATSSQARQD